MESANALDYLATSSTVDDSEGLLDTALLSVEEAAYKLLIKYLEKHPYLGPNALENSDVRRSTVRSVLNGGGTHKLSPRTLCGLMRSLHKGKTLKEVASFYSGPLGDALQGLVNSFAGNADLEYKSNRVEALYEDISTFKIVILASKKNGITQRELVEEMGNQCRTSIDRLLQEKVLVKKNNRIYTSKENSLGKTAGISTIQKLAANLLQTSFWPDNFGVEKFNNSLSVKVVEVNPEWYRPRALEALQEYLAKLEDIVSQPEAKGDVCQWHIDAYCDLTNPNLGNEKEEV